MKALISPAFMSFLQKKMNEGVPYSDLKLSKL